jgi:glycosyltransferase involved in cell wall biosynthesis
VHQESIIYSPTKKFRFSEQFAFSKPSKIMYLNPLKPNKGKSLQSLQVKICTQFFPPDYAATGQLIEELSVHLERLGIRVQIFTGQPGYAFQNASAPLNERHGNLLIQRSRSSQIWRSRIRGKGLNGILFFLRTLLHLFKTSREGKVLLLTTAPPFLPIAGYLMNLCFGIPYVCLLYDLYPDIAVKLNVVPAHHGLVRLWHWLNKQVWKRAQSIIVLSSTMKENVEMHCPAVSDKIAVIHSWADPDWITPLPKQYNSFAHEHQLVDRFTVLYSGNIGRCHDMNTILEAAHKLQHDAVQFVFIGEGAKRKDCVAQAEEWGLQNCQFLPYQDKQDLPYSLTACDLSLVSVSPGMEGLVAPSKLYGTLAAGRPVAAVCEPHSYLRSLITKANCGATFKNGDAEGLAQFIRCLATDRVLAKRMGIAGRQYLQANFTPEKIARQYAEVLFQGASKDWESTHVAQVHRLEQGVAIESKIISHPHVLNHAD